MINVATRFSSYSKVFLFKFNILEKRSESRTFYLGIYLI